MVRPVSNSFSSYTPFIQRFTFVFIAASIASSLVCSRALADNADDEILPSVEKARVPEIDTARVQSIEMTKETVSGMSLPPPAMDSVGAASTSVMRRDHSPVAGEGGVSVYFLTSRTTQNLDYRTMKSMGGGGGGDGSGGGSGGGDGGGGNGGGQSLPNLNYVMASGYLPLSSRDTISVIGQQSLDSADKLRINNPQGPDFLLPSEVAMLRYRYEFSPSWAADLRGGYINTVGFRDPSVGATYVHLSPRGWVQAYQASASTPVTSQSIDDHLITRATLRTQFTKRISRWAFVAGLAHTHTFYNGDPPARARGGSGRGSQASAGSDRTIPIYPTDVDVILIQREMQRTRTDMSVAYAVSDQFTLGAGAGLSQATTERNRIVWMTSAKPVIMKYIVNQAEIGADLSLNSDIQDFNAPRLPSFLTIGMRLGYTFGQKAIPN